MPSVSSDAPIVHIIDDDNSLRSVLDSLFRSVGLKTATYGSTKEFVDARKSDSPGCIVLDIRLPGVSGLDFQTQLGELDISLPVIMITGHADVPMSVRAMKAGAIDFLPKPFRDQDMLDAVSRAIDLDTKHRMARRDAAQVVHAYATLSQRERQVMLLVTTGKMNKQAARELGISEVTVKIHRGAAMRKMGAHTLAELVRMVDALKTIGALTDADTTNTSV